MLDPGLRWGAVSQEEQELIGRLVFSGYSDDISCWNLHGADGKEIRADEHDDCAKGSARVWRVTWRGESVDVVAIYAPGPRGVWAIGLAQIDEDAKLPKWAREVSFSASGYTVELAMLVGADVEVKLVAPEPGEAE